MRKIVFLLYLFSVLTTIVAQEGRDIQIVWINTPSSVQESHITLKWGIKAKNQITDISISLNGTHIKGINAVVNDGFDMTNTQVLNLAKGDNVIEITVTTTKNSIKEFRTIKFISDNHDDSHEQFGGYVNVDSMIVASYRGEAKAQFYLGKSYLYGKNGLEKDLFESSLWFKKSAELHYAPSMYEYSVALMEGRGIMKNKTQGINWLKQSAKGNYALAQLKLGICYETGEGVGKDIEKAKELYRKCPLAEAKQRLQVLEKQ